MSPEQRDIRALQAEGFPAGMPIRQGTRPTETRQQWLERRQQEDFEQAMRGVNAPDELGD